MKDQDKLSIAYDGCFVAGELILCVDGAKVSAGRKKNGGFIFTAKGKALLDTLPKREPAPAPKVEAPVVEEAAPPVERRTRKRRKTALGSANEADDK